MKLPKEWECVSVYYCVCAYVRACAYLYVYNHLKFLIYKLKKINRKFNQKNTHIKNQKNEKNESKY